MKRFIGLILFVGGLLFTIVMSTKIVSPDIMQTVSIGDALSGNLPDDLAYVAIDDGTLYLSDGVEHSKVQKDNPSMKRAVRYLVPLVDDELARAWDSIDLNAAARPDLRGENGRFVLVSFKPDTFLSEFPSVAAGNATSADEMYVQRRIRGEVLSRIQIPKDVADFVRTSFKLSPDQYIYIKEGKEPSTRKDNIVATVVFGIFSLVGWAMFRKKKPRTPRPEIARAGDFASERY